MKLKRVMIASCGSGGGKTTVTCALLQCLKEAGLQTAAHKCGPDYIDPMFHENVIGVPSENLDTFFTGEKGTLKLFLRDKREGELAVIEGVMGLYDGLGGIYQEGSSYHLARITNTPILLVVDARGMGRSVIALLAGFLAYDRQHLIRGVIFNRMSEGYYRRIKPLVEKELGICAVGYLPENKGFSVGSRHLGLVLPGELADLKQKLGELAEDFRRTVSMDRILEIAAGAGEVSEEISRTDPGRSSSLDAPGGAFDGRPVIGVARDEAFCFYYRENLRLLEKYGAVIRYFSPLRDRMLPESCCGLMLGGGYPELFGERLSANTAMRRAVRQAAAEGMPLVAECGGFMYLHSAMVDQEGKSHAMAGVIPAVCRSAGRLVRFGYVELEEKNGRFLPKGEKIRGHEFHYFDSTDNGGDCLAVKTASGESYPCIWAGETWFMGFAHLYYPSNPVFAERFVKKAAAYGRRMRSN